MRHEIQRILDLTGKKQLDLVQSYKDILPMAQDKGVAVTINRPFINGQYFKLIKGYELPGWAAEFDCESWAQFSLKIILSHPAKPTKHVQKQVCRCSR